MKYPSFRQAAWLAASIAVAALAACGGDDDEGSGPTVTSLSSKPDYVSGGSVLIDVALGASTTTTTTALTATLNGADVASAFKADPLNAGHMVGLVTGVKNGANALVVANGGASTTYSMTGYPITGPIISGPHQTPFICQTSTFALPDASLLGAPLDADCTATPRVTYMYLATGATALAPLPSTTALPANVASTTTLAGTTVPFVVRVETSTVNRGIYQSAVLHNPTTESAPTPVVPPKGWNRRLIAVEGFGCPGGWYIQGGAQGNLAIAGFDFSLLSVKRLGEGYATFANTLQHASNDCNAVLASEAAMMSKEAFIKTYGAPILTVSAGCSGGSYGSSQPADRIPGLFDGILIACTFPDPLGIAFSGSDGHLLSHYWAVTNPTGFTDAQKVAVSGYKSMQAFLDAANQAGRTDPVAGRVDISGYASATWNPLVPVAQRYDPVTNKTGARPTVYDASKNIYGVDKTTGFALRPFDNVGVQYGLAELNAGTITPAQFLDLNANIGGYDQDANYVAGRTVGNVDAIKRAQQAGLQLGGNGGLAQIPVFDVTGIYNDDGGYHYQWFHFSMRERMLKANGDTKNHVMWRGNPVPAETAWSAFMNWVVAYKADVASGTQRDKVIRNKPAQATDGCWSNATTFINEAQTLSSTGNSQCNTLFPSWTFPRAQAGESVAADIMKCTLKPVAASDYAVAFGTADLARLQTVFPSGVCDFTKAGVNQTGVVTDGSFGPSPINLLFDVTGL
ncbi:MAG: hypothetical protein JWQ11_2236 [Rhizobacter sp.]|nr:hypothetical protein [Rhizobacter sp.]